MEVALSWWETEIEEEINIDDIFTDLDNMETFEDEELRILFGRGQKHDVCKDDGNEGRSYGLHTDGISEDRKEKRKKTSSGQHHAEFGRS